MFIRPDLVILESGETKGHVDFKDILHFDKPEHAPEYDYEKHALKVDKNFSIAFGKNNFPIFAAGESCTYKSFVSKGSYRTPDVKYNIEAGFYASMCMLDKAMIFNHIPMTRLNLPDREIYYVGERGFKFDEFHIDGDVASGKYVVYFFKGEEIMGFVTIGF